MDCTGVGYNGVFLGFFFSIETCWHEFKVTAARDLHHEHLSNLKGKSFWYKGSILDLYKYKK